MEAINGRDGQQHRYIYRYTGIRGYRRQVSKRYNIKHCANIFLYRNHKNVKLAPVYMIMLRHNFHCNLYGIIIGILVHVCQLFQLSKRYIYKLLLTDVRVGHYVSFSYPLVTRPRLLNYTCLMSFSDFY